jgi:hypothetical protein
MDEHKMPDEQLKPLDALISDIAIDIAIAASKTSAGEQLDRSDFPTGYNAIEAAENDGAMRVYVEAAREIIKKLQA